MDPVAGFDDDEHDDFFRRHDAEDARQSHAAFESEPTEPSAPTPEQLAHFGRFRKPVALIVGAMSVLSVAGLALRRSEHALLPEAPRAHRGLVAHYGAALTAPPPAASSAPVAPAVAAPAGGYVWKTFAATPNMCLLDPNLDSAWLSVGLEPSSSEWSSVRLGRVSSARGRRPACTPSPDLHITPPAHEALAPHVVPASAAPVRASPPAAPVRTSPPAAPALSPAAPVLTPPLKPPVARFPDNR